MAPSLRCPTPVQTLDKKLLADGQKTTKLLLRGLDIEVEAGAGHPVSRFLRCDQTRNALIIDGDANGIAQLTKSGQEEEEEEPDAAEDDEEEDDEENNGDREEEEGGDEEESEVLSAENVHAHWWFASDIWHSNTVTSTIARLLSREEIVIPLDDLAEIRPGKVSAVVDNSEDHQTCMTFVSSSAILVLPLGDTALRNTLLQKFQSFLLVSPTVIICNLLLSDMYFVCYDVFY